MDRIVDMTKFQIWSFFPINPTNGSTTVYFSSFSIANFSACPSFCLLVCVGGAVAQSVERATPGEEVPGSIPASAARSLLAGWVSV